MPVLNFFPTDPRAQAAFQFDHAQAHATLAQGLPQQSNLALYLLDPMLGDFPASNWNQVHQTAHDAAAVWYGVQPSLQLIDETAGGPFWTFINDQEHRALATAQLIKSG